MSFCVYLTVYRGNKLPPFYIGSSSVAKISNGYRGSVSSRQFKKVWNSEIKANSDLFKTIVLKIFGTRVEATKFEQKLHLQLNVVKNPLYINLATAIPNGKFGLSSKGRNNPMYGVKRPDATLRMKTNNPMFDTGVVNEVKRKKKVLFDTGLHKSTRNKTETLRKTADRMKVVNPNHIRCSCIICKAETTPSAITRHHKH